MSDTDVKDVIIIGGGPAGSTTATLLARRGLDVMVLERERFPRDHVGESLLPFCFELLGELGVLDKLKRTFVRKPGVRFMDIDGTNQTTWCFREVIKDESYLSFHVLRAEFDKILLDNSRENGVDVREETAVRDVRLDAPDGLVEVDAETTTGEKTTYRARFLVDASGQKTFLANRNGWKTPDPDLDRVATFTHWEGPKPLPEFDEGLLIIVSLGGEKKGWIWTIPIAADRLSVGVVLENKHVKQQKRKFEAAGSDDWLRDMYREEVLSSPFLRDALEPATLVEPVNTIGNYSYSVSTKYGSRFAMVGDSSTFIDPIFASGVFLGMQSAKIVSAAIAEHLAGAGPAPEDSPALDAAYGHIAGAYELLGKVIRTFYNPESISFAQMGEAAPVIHEQHETALALGHFLLAGDFFERHQEYLDFLELLKDPKVLTKHKQLVIDRRKEQQKAGTCGMQRADVFPAIMREAARKRGEDS